MQSVTVAEAAEKLTDLIDAALQGEEIVITKGDCLIRLTLNKLVKNRQPGSAKGQVSLDEPLEEFKNYS